MNAMDQLFVLYNQHFDRIEQSANRLNELYPQPSELPMERMSRERFEQFLSNGIANEAKCLFLKRVLNGHEELLPVLPNHVKMLARKAA